MSYGYGGQNPYDQRGQGGYGAQGGYGQTSPFGGNSGYNQLPAGDAGYGANVEMESLAQNSGKSILDQCKEIKEGIDSIHTNLENIQALQSRSLNEADSSTNSETNRRLETISADTMALYRGLTDQIRHIKSDPKSRSGANAKHVEMADRRLKDAIHAYQQVESKFRQNNEDQIKRQYLIVRPDATEEELRAAVEDTGGQVFSQALMQSDRQGRARAALGAVQDRHAALQKIEQQMVELAQLFQDMDTLVVQQEAPIMQIEQKAEEVVDNLDKGNEEIGVAVNTARKTRKKKWICLGISVLIIVIIVIIVLIYIFVVKGGNNGGNNNNNSKRAIIEDIGNLNIVNTLPIHEPARLLTRFQGGASEGFRRVARERVHLPQMLQ